MTISTARYGVCEGVLRQGSFAADVALVRTADIAAIGVDAAAVAEVGVGEAARILDGEGVQVSSYLPLPDILTTDGGTSPMGEIAQCLDVAARLGAPGALVGTGPLGARTLDAADAACRTWLEQAGALANERGLRIMLEPMHPLLRRWSYVHTFRDALSIVDQVAGVGVVLDLGHVWWERDLADLVRDRVDAIVSVQLTNVDTAALEDVRYERCPFDAGDVPVAQLVGSLDAAGYQGWYENEVLARIPRDERLDMLIRSREWFEAL